MSQVDIAAAHRRLYDQIPTFTCRPGCSDCCGPIPLSKHEASQLKDGGAAIEGRLSELLKGVTSCLDCPHSTILGCGIYADRPFMCRIFGAVDDPILKCPHGCGPEKPLTASEGRELKRAYQSIFDL